MRKGVRGLWCHSLREGFYRRGSPCLLKRVIGHTTSWSVWGVLTQLFHWKTGKGEWTPKGFVLDGKTFVQRPPPQVLEWAGIDTELITRGSGVTGTLTTLDEWGMFTFEDLAELIEDNL